MSRIVDTIRRQAWERNGAGRRLPRSRGSPELGVVQYFHLGDRETAERVLDELRWLPIAHLRTAVSWCDWTREGGEQWYDWLLPRLAARFEVVPCVLYTPPELAVAPKTSAPPRDPQAYGEFVAMMLRRHQGLFRHVELWNEPNNYIEWDWTIDPEWRVFADMIASAAARASALGVAPVLGGMSPFDPNWLDLMFRRGALADVEVIGVHGFPGTWEAVWDGWDAHIDRVQEVIDRHDGTQRIWITEAGYSTWAHDEFRQVRVMAELAEAPAERAYWYSAEDLAPERETLDGFHCDERAYHFGLHRRDGQPKLLARVLAERGRSGVAELLRLGTARQARPATRPGALITGGAGFIGTNLADRLASSGTPVTVLDSLARAGVEENLRWLTRKHGELVQAEVGDVRDRFAIQRAMDRCDRVFHMAAQVAVTTSLADPLADHEVNIGGIINVLEEARRLDCPPAIVFTSTNKVYGPLTGIELREGDRRHEPVDPRVRGRGISERQPLAFSSPYGCSKGAADQYVLDYAHSFGLATCVLRMSCIYGPHQRGTADQGWVAHFVLRALRSEPITVFGDGKQVRDLLYVDDLVDALLIAGSAEPAVRGRAFNIGGGVANAMSVLEVLELIEEIGGTQPEIEWADWRIADQRYYVSDTAAFESVDGWKQRVPVAEGLERLYESLTARVESSPAQVAAAPAA